MSLISWFYFVETFLLPLSLSLKIKDSVFIMGRDTNCKQDVVDQNGDISEKEIAFSHCSICCKWSVLKPLGKLTWWNVISIAGVCKVQVLLSEKAPHCSSLYFSLQSVELFFLWNVKEMLKRNCFIYVAEAFFFQQRRSNAELKYCKF